MATCFQKSLSLSGSLTNLKSNIDPPHHQILRKKWLYGIKQSMWARNDFVPHVLLSLKLLQLKHLFSKTGNTLTFQSILKLKRE